MKKILLALLASTAVGGAAVAQEFPDVPAGSYAEEAVARLADLGIVIGFPDGTFRGNEAFTRYQAALVVTRLLDVVESEALTDADLDTVRNALQELAADVAANEQAVSDLQAAIDGSAGADAEAVEQLQAQLDALMVELDTLNAAQSAAAGLEQQVAQNADQISQLSDLVGILNEDLAAVAAGGDVDTSFLAEIEQNSSDIANLREFVVLLRRDQVGVSERVAAIEESDTAQSAQLADLETRVTALEEAQVAFSGSIGLQYEVGRLSGAEVPFDVDRIFGIGLPREQPVSYFSSGTEDLNDDGDEDDAGEEAQDRDDIENERGNFGPELTLNVDFSAERGLAPESGLNSFESTVVLELEEATVLDGDADVSEDGFDFTDPDNYFDAYVFEFSSVTATLGPIGAEPLTFYFGEDPEASFTDYVFESLGPGFRVEIGTPDFLAFLQPTLQVAYGVFTQGGNDDNPVDLPDDSADQLALDGAPVGNPFTDAYYRGVRGTLTPFSGEGFAATGGFSFAQIEGNADENADALGDNLGVTVYGVDGQVNLSIFNVEFEYAQNDVDAGVNYQASGDTLQNDDGEDIGFDGELIEDGADAIPVVAALPSTTLYYADVTIDTEAAGIPLLQSLSANYRSIPALWYGLKSDDAAYPWELDQVGFGAEASIGLSIFSLTGFYDQYTIGSDVTEIAADSGAEVTGNEVAAYGVRLGAELYRAIEVYGFYNYVTLDGVHEYVAGLGLGLEHDGTAENALLPGVNFNVAYDFTEQNVTAASIDTETTLGVFTIAPFVDYNVDFSAAQNSDDTRTIRAGLNLTTEPLDVLLQPSLAANVNYRNAVHEDVAADVDDYIADILQYSVGVEFGQFLLENSTFAVRYGSFTATNVTAAPNINGSGDFASDISDGDEPGTGTQTTNGYELLWNYYGLEFGYGAYVNSNPVEAADDGLIPGDTGGQVFRIAYTVNF
jgi:hypothetical protein